MPAATINLNPILPQAFPTTTMARGARKSSGSAALTLTLQQNASSHIRSTLARAGRDAIAPERRGPPAN
eukprot:8845051-Pyramimonas_sp.AAC.1